MFKQLLPKRTIKLSLSREYTISSYKVGSDYTRADIIRKKGSDLVHEPLYYKGMAFTQSERDRLNLRGLVPPNYMDIET